jgi:hypothetical protein
MEDFQPGTLNPEPLNLGLCLGGENVFSQNVVDPPLEGKKFTNKTLNADEEKRRRSAQPTFG